MARLVWDQEAQKRYEFGVDHGVYYPPDSPGVVWNGLLSVTESHDGGDLSSYHFDGNKYLDIVNPKTYGATLEAYSSPKQFLKAVGFQSVTPGFILTRQTRDRFGLSYRTFSGPGEFYKIHVIYNILASPDKKSYRTTDSSQSIESISWKLNAVPLTSNTYRSTAHYIVDSFKLPPENLKLLEDIIYGTDTTPARLPTFEEWSDIIILWSFLFIEPDPLTGLSKLMPGPEDLYRTKPEGLLRATPNTRLQPSSIDGLYRLE